MDKSKLFTARQLCLQASDCVQKAMDILEELSKETGNMLPPQSNTMVEYTFGSPGYAAISIAIGNTQPVLCHCGGVCVLCRCDRGTDLTQCPHHAHCVRCNQIYDITTAKPVPS